jgi:aspartate/methionine/tyrosine aminotransferase
MGARETAAQIVLTVLNPSDVALTPDPGYDCYKAGIILTGGHPLTYSLYKINNYHRVVSEIPKEFVKQTKLMIINYVHNSTSAVASSDLFEEIVDWANRNNIVICHDNPYVEVVYDGEEPKSFLQAEGARQVGVELFSFSKT